MIETYLVTGAAGFIGARFVEAAGRAGIRVVSVDESATFDARPEHAGLDFGTRVDRDDLEAWLAQQPARSISAVVHLGACTDTMELDEAIHERLNVAYTKMLWSWCSKHEVPLVYASSAATYGGGERGYDDDETQSSSLEPLNPYGWSKQRVDLWILARERAGEKPKAWAGFKFFNVYGFGERHKGRMASVVLHGYDQIKKAGEIALFKSHKPPIADGDQRRDFVYVEDVVEVLMFAASGKIPRGIFNLGTGKARSFADLACATFAALGKDTNIRYIDMPEALRERYQYFTEAKMDRLRAAGWDKPFSTLEDGVRRYVERLVSSGSGG